MQTARRFRQAALAVAFLPLAAGMGLRAEQSSGAVVTYHGDLAPILSRKCVPCHSPGGNAPFYLQNYDQVRKRGWLIRQMVLIRYMPPCDAVSEFGEFCETPMLTDYETVLVQRWVQHGMKQGPAGGAAPTPARALRIQGPSRTLRPTAPIQIEPEGAPYWRIIRIPLNLPPGTRIRSFDILPETAEPFRNAVVGLGPISGPDSSTGDLSGQARMMLGVWAPGYAAWSLPPGLSVPVRSGDALLVQVLYRPTGKRENGGFSVGIGVTDDPTDDEPRWITLGKEEFEIPAGDATKLYDERELEGLRVHSVLPEARSYATEIRVALDAPGKGSRALMHTYKWNRLWRGNYQFPEPVAVPAGSTLSAYIQYSNDKHSPRNEGRTPAVVRSGPGEEDELFRVHLLVAPERAFRPGRP